MYLSATCASQRQSLDGERDARLGRKGSFAASLVAASVLNMFVLSVFAAAAGRWQTPSGQQQRTSWITAVPVKAAVPEPAPVDLTLSASKGMSSIQPESLAATEPKPEPVTSAKAPSTAIDQGNETRFYRSGEVDRPAEPDDDWNLDAAALDAAGIETLIFDIFIGSRGEVIDCVVIAPTMLADDTRQRLTLRLRETAMRPAVRGDTPVPSVRRMEVSVR